MLAVGLTALSCLETVVDALTPINWLLHTALTLIIHATIRQTLDKILTTLYSKRHRKESIRASHAETFQNPHWVCTGIRKFFTLSPEAQELPAEERLGHRLVRCNGVLLWGYLPVLALCFLSWRISFLRWVALLAVVTESALWVGLRIACPNHKSTRKSNPPEAQPPQSVFICICAYFLRYGYLLLALVFLAIQQTELAAFALFADALHTVLARQVHADHFYCMMQNISHQPMTPHRHFVSERRHAEKESVVVIVLSPILGIAALLLGWMH